MGALHEGHAALIRRGAETAAEGRHAAGCIVTIFVNPTQFNEKSDFDRYPRTLEADLQLCERSGAAAVFAPDVETVYPGWPASEIEHPPLPAVATEPGLEDRHRPGHFEGVCRVVLRLFRLLEPSGAVFGEKDWQQLQVIRAMTRGLALPIEIIPHPTVREPDGLAMSSRNRFLSTDERSKALTISRALSVAGRLDSPGAAERAMREALTAGGLSAEYAVVRRADSLRTLGEEETGRSAGSCRALIAARVGSTRLIDNAPWPAR